MRWALIGLSLIFMLSLLLVCSQQPTLSANHGQTTQDILSASPSQSELLAEGVTDSEILIGMSAAFTGVSHSLGIELYRGAMAYFVEINRSGGVHGRKIVLKAYDDGYQPDQAVKNTLNKLMLEDRVFLLFD
jgi:ABC-type branched-subunit amino acid transport system substrate-binding protein